MACAPASACLGRSGSAARGDPTAVLWLGCALAGALPLSVAASRGAARPRGRAFAGLVVLGALYVCQSLTYFIALTVTPVALLAGVFAMAASVTVTNLPSGPHWLVSPAGGPWSAW